MSFNLQMASDLCKENGHGLEDDFFTGFKYDLVSMLHQAPASLIDEETGDTYSYTSWELKEERTYGDYEGSRDIGSANHMAGIVKLMEKFRFVSPTTIDIAEEQRDFTVLILNLFLKELEEEGIIRQDPVRVRETFVLHINENWVEPKEENNE